MHREGEPSVHLITENGASWMDNLFSYKTLPHPKWTEQCSVLLFPHHFQNSHRSENRHIFLYVRLLFILLINHNIISLIWGKIKMDSETEVCATDAEILKISYFKYATKSLIQKRKNCEIMREGICKCI